MPESVTDRPTMSHEHVFLLAKRATYYYDAEAIKEPAVYPGGPNAPDKIQSPMGQGFTRRAGRWPGIGPQHGRERDRDERYEDMAQHATRNRRSVWTISTRPFPEAHFATFPEDLVEPCVLAGSPHGGLVLDPFCGSGTVGLVCNRLGRRFVGLELNESYCRMAYRRTAQMGLA